MCVWEPGHVNPAALPRTGGRRIPGWQLLEDERQYADLFFADGVERVRIQSQDSENGRRHLLVQDWRLDLLSRPTLPGKQQSHVKIIFIQAAVLGDLGAAGEDHAGVGLENDVGGALVAQRAVELLCKRVPGEDLLDAESILAGREAQIGDN